MPPLTLSALVIWPSLRAKVVRVGMVLPRESYGLERRQRCSLGVDWPPGAWIMLVSESRKPS